MSAPPADPKRRRLHEQAVERSKRRRRKGKGPRWNRPGGVIGRALTSAGPGDLVRVQLGEGDTATVRTTEVYDGSGNQVEARSEVFVKCGACRGTGIIEGRFSPRRVCRLCRGTGRER